MSFPTATPALIPASDPIPRDGIMAVAIGILVLALLGGVFVSLGNAKNDD
jgi:hypothetical protein